MKKLFKIIFLTFIVLFLIFFLFFQAGATTFEQFNNRSQSLGSVYDVYIKAQTFTPTTTHTSFGVKLWLGASATRKTTFVVYLIAKTPQPDYRVNYLSKGQIYASSVNTTIGGNEYHILFDNISPALATNTKYSIILENTSATSGTSISGHGDNSGYASGSSWYSNDGGRNWTEDILFDYYFKIMGEVPCTSSEDMCVCTTTLSYVQNTTTGAGFWLDSSISLGDFLIASFLLAILVLFIIHFIFGLEIPKRVNLRKV